jgi:hypothetical protein
MSVIRTRVIRTNLVSQVDFIHPHRLEQKKLAVAYRSHKSHVNFNLARTNREGVRRSSLHLDIGLQHVCINHIVLAATPSIRVFVVVALTVTRGGATPPAAVIVFLAGSRPLLFLLHVSILSKVTIVSINNIEEKTTALWKSRRQCLWISELFLSIIYKLKGVCSWWLLLVL